MTEKSALQQKHYEAMLANGDYDLLLQVLQQDAQSPNRKGSATELMVRVHAIRGDKAKTQQALAEAVQLYSMQGRIAAQESLEAMICCCERDVEGDLKAVADKPTFEAEFLRGQLKQAVDLAGLNEFHPVAYYGLLYLEAARSGAKELAEAHWDDLLANLKKGGREEQSFGEILAGRKPLAAHLPQRMPIEPTKKRVLLAVMTPRYPDQAEELLTLAENWTSIATRFLYV